MAVARRFVRQFVASRRLDDVADTAVLLTSEIVTNAVIHAGTEIEISCHVVNEHGAVDALEIAVRDRHPTRHMPVQPSLVDSDAESGRGLALAVSLSSSWGVEYTATHKKVWFRMTRERVETSEGDARPSLPPVPQELPAPPDTVDGAALPVPRENQGPDSEHASVAVVRTNDAGRISFWSTEAAQLFGWTAEQVTGRPLSDLLSCEEPDTAESILELPRWQGVYAVRRADGTTVEVFADHVRAESGPVGRAAVCLIVSAEHRRLLEPLLVRPKGPHSAARSAGALGDTPLSGSGRNGLALLLGRVCEAARELLDSDAAFVLLASDDDRVLEMRASTGLVVPGETPLVITDDTDELPKALQLPRVLDDLSGTDLAELADTGIVSAVTVPLSVGQRVIGVLAGAARTPAAFTRDDAVRLSTLADEVVLPVESARLTVLEADRRDLLGFLADASELLASTLDPVRTTALVTQLVVPRLARWCAVHSLDQNGRPQLDQVWHVDENQLDELRAALDAVAPDDTEPHPALAGEVTLVLPLVARGRRIGSLTVGREPGSRFSHADTEVCEDLARRAALALDNARLYADRTRASQALQRSLLPRRLPEIPGIELGVAYAAAGEGNEVGGDFYDVFAIAENRWGFAVGDVCGKGPEAAALTGLVRHSLRVHAGRGDPLPSVLRHLNEAVLEETEGERFITLLYGELWHQPDGREGNGNGVARVVFACAGHPLPVRVAPGGAVATVGSPQPLMGVIDDVDYTVDSVDLRPGESLVAFTDGVTERRCGSRMFGDVDLSRTLAQASALPANALVERTEQAVLAFDQTAPRDDMAVLVLRVR